MENKTVLHMNKEDIKNFKPTGEMLKSAELVFLNMAYVGTIKPIVEKYQNEALHKFKFQYKRKDDREFYYKKTGFNYVVDDEHTYMIKDKDFKIYLKEMEKQHKEHGFNVKKNYCPLLIAKDNLRQSENLLMSSFECITGLKSSEINMKLDTRKKFLDLTLNYMSRFINKDKVLRELV